ncbi:MAG: YihY family inner membrane protein [Deltaproteobacteria bacterium]|nr:YihY family inner membrane protein [Deltaproteobacteria bacterium]
MKQLLPAWIRSFFRIVRLVFQRIHSDRILGRSAEMAYLTLLALVPVAAILLSLLARVWTVSEKMVQIQQRLFELVIPSTAVVVIDYIHSFAQNATAVSYVGFIFFLLAAAGLFNGIEATFNNIWGLKRSRPRYVKLLAFCGFFTVAPFLLGLSTYVTVYVADLEVFREMLGVGFVHRILRVGIPYLLTFLGFSVAYFVMPHSKVRKEAALIGGGVAALLWEGAKEGFDYYISHVVDYSHLYGALGVIPIFLVWLYVSWLAILFGAELSFVLHNHTKGMDII